MNPMMNHRHLSFVRCFSFTFFLLVFSFSPGAKADIEPSAQDVITEYFIVDVEGAGDVQILKEGQTEWQGAHVGSRLEEGDQISVGGDTEAVLSLKSETVVHLDEGTKMSVARLEENQTNGFLSRLTLLTGAILSDVRKHLSENNSQFEVESGGVVCGVRGTVFEVANNDGAVQTSTDEGVVDLKTPKGTRQVAAGQTCSTSKSGVSSIRPSDNQTKGRFQAWRQIRRHLGQKRASHGNKPLRLGRNPANHGTTGAKTSHVLPPSHGSSSGHR
jgi:hypothetical protein